MNKDILKILAQQALNNTNKPKDYSNDDLANATAIFFDVLTNKMFDLVEAEQIPFPIACNMAQSCGVELRNVIKKYTNIDTHEIV